MSYPKTESDDTAVSFDEVYSRRPPAYGMRPSRRLESILQSRLRPGYALDLGAGAGRNSLALAGCGHRVMAIDQSSKGIECLQHSAIDAAVADRIVTRVGDVRDLAWAHRQYRVIVAATLLDHLPEADLPWIWREMSRALAPGGTLYVEVHTTDDPASPRGRGSDSDVPTSETAAHVRHYFRPNELLRLAQARFRIIEYQERLEWDFSHGHPHQHGKAYLVATTLGGCIDWFGKDDRERHEHGDE